MNDEAYTLHIEPEKIQKQKGYFRKGNIPWNKGLTWEQQGWTGERKKKVVAQLLKNRKNNPYSNLGNHFKHPVIQMDEYGDRLHWYESSEAAARKLGVNGRNIRRTCDGQRKHCAGYRWRWDENFR